MASKAKAAVEDHIKQFYSRKEVKEYIEAYRSTLDAFIHPAPIETEPTASFEEMKAEARAKAMEFAIELANNIKQAEDPEYVIRLLDKVGILDGNERAEEEPRRYLPQDCGSCAYRMFCEENTEDMCKYCKYHKFGEDNGVHYDKTKMLDVQAKFGTELAEEK